MTVLLILLLLIAAQYSSSGTVFKSIITNKNNTAIAPTYIITINKPKKSAPKIKQIAAAFKNVNTKKRIECTEFSDKNTNNAEIIIKQFKKI